MPVVSEGLPDIIHRSPPLGPPPAPATCKRADMAAGPKLVAFVAEGSSGGAKKKGASSGSGSKEEEAWARKHLPQGTPVYTRSQLTEAILHQSLDKPLMTV